ncbi:unnamed protein product [Musa acuminata var. zebrina]
MLLEACFDGTNDGSIIDGIDEILELIKKTWLITRWLKLQRMQK